MHLLAGVVALAAIPGALAGMYPKSSAVLQVDSKSYDKLIAKSDYTSIVEFYAPWCGHCQNLKPAYEKAAVSLNGLANVAAVDCDDDANKSLCGQMGIQGFPTLKIVRPGKKPGKPAVEDYQGPRTAAGIVEAVQDRMNNHVKKVTDKDVESFISESEQPKALLFTEKGTTSSLLKAIAIDFKDAVTIGQVRNTQKAVVEKYGVDSYPTLLLLPPGGAEPIKYDGELKKAPMVEFISQLASPNAKTGKKDDTKKSKKSEEKPVAEPEASPEAAPEDDASEKPSASPSAPVIPPIPSITTGKALQDECFQPKSHSCLLYLGSMADEVAVEDAASAILATLAHKHAQAGRHIMPFYEIPAGTDGFETVHSALSLSSKGGLVVVNNRRGWYKSFSGEYDAKNIEAWLDAIRMGEGEKKDLPEVKFDGGDAEKKVEDAKEDGDSSAAGTIAHAPDPETDGPVEEPSEVPPKEEDTEPTPSGRDEL